MEHCSLLGRDDLSGFEKTEESWVHIVASERAVYHMIPTVRYSGGSRDW
jgi:hypothetical protein